MLRSEPDRSCEGHWVETADGRGIALGETFHKKNIPWILWTVTRINTSIEPVHIELTMRKDSKTRITVSINALTSHRYFLPCGDEGSIFPPIRHAGMALRNGRSRVRAAIR